MIFLYLRIKIILRRKKEVLVRIRGINLGKYRRSLRLYIVQNRIIFINTLIININNQIIIKVITKVVKIIVKVIKITVIIIRNKDIINIKMEMDIIDKDIAVKDIGMIDIECIYMIYRNLIVFVYEDRLFIDIYSSKFYTFGKPLFYY